MHRYHNICNKTTGVGVKTPKPPFPVNSITDGVFTPTPAPPFKSEQRKLQIDEAHDIFNFKG